MKTEIVEFPRLKVIGVESCSCNACSISWGPRADIGVRDERGEPICGECGGDLEQYWVVDVSDLQKAATIVTSSADPVLRAIGIALQESCKRLYRSKVAMTDLEEAFGKILVGGIIEVIDAKEPNGIPTTEDLT